jgi:hypothetical protein
VGLSYRCSINATGPQGGGRHDLFGELGAASNLYVVGEALFFRAFREELVVLEGLGYSDGEVCI